MVLKSGRGSEGINGVLAVSFTHLEEVGVAEGRGQAEDVVPFRVLRDGLENGARRTVLIRTGLPGP